MYEVFTQERIAELRIKAGVSARDMSLSLGQNESYINRIENKRSLPSLSVLFWICEYFKITPQEFFDQENHNPEKINKLVAAAKGLSDEKLDHLIAITEGLA